jgi:hypothetical protein
MEELRSLLEKSGIDTATLRPASLGYRLVTDNAMAVETWLRLRSVVPRAGLWPILLGDYAEDIREPVRRKTGAILTGAVKIDPPAWFAEALRLELEELRTQLDEAREEGDDDFADSLDAIISDGGFPRGPWPVSGEQAACGVEPFSIHFAGEDLGGRLDIALLPARDCWEVPAVVGFGGWNECPPAEVHVALMRYWHERYGAEPMTLAGDVVEMSVARPPMTREAALGLAKEKFLYCRDIVDQGTETIDGLAAEDVGSPMWFFWWD